MRIYGYPAPPNATHPPTSLVPTESTPPVGVPPCSSKWVNIFPKYRGETFKHIWNHHLVLGFPNSIEPIAGRGRRSRLIRGARLKRVAPHLGTRSVRDFRREIGVWKTHTQFGLGKKRSLGWLVMVFVELVGMWFCWVGCGWWTGFLYKTMYIPSLKLIGSIKLWTLGPKPQSKGSSSKHRLFRGFVV